MEMGLGIIIHDDRGHHFLSRSHVMPGLYELEEDGTIGLHEALSWIKDLGVTKVVIEMNAKNVVDAVNGHEEYNSVFGDILGGCKGLLSSLPFVLVKWIPRDVNIMAYCIAKVAMNFSSPYYWEERPVCVDDLLDSFCTC
ncbi:hypothetical protein ACS0TY_002054 [Phlomoides rotata]